MWRLSEIIVLLVLISISQFHNTTAAIKFYKKSFSYPQKQVICKNYSFKDGNLVYAVCDGSSEEKNCAIIHRQLPHGKVTHSCNITIKVGHQENANLVDLISVNAFGKENAIVFWDDLGSQTTFKLMTIQMKSCNSNLLELNDPKESIYKQQILSHKIVTYDNDFDMFINGIDYSSGFNDTQVKFRINLSGKIGEPTASIKSGSDHVRFISPIATRSPARGYIYSKFERDNPYSLFLAKPDGSERILTRQKEYSIAISSAVYDLITSCIEPDVRSNTTCTQFDENGDIKFKMTLDSIDKKEAIPTLVHNSPCGGFLAMIITYGTLKGEVDYDSVISYRVVRVDSQGRNVGSVQLDHFVEAHNIMKSLHLWENGEEYCAASIGQAYDEQNPDLRWDNIHIVVNCFGEEDFTV